MPSGVGSVLHRALAGSITRCTVRWDLGKIDTAPEPHILLFRREKDYQEKVSDRVCRTDTVRPAWKTFRCGKN